MKKIIYCSIGTILVALITVLFVVNRQLMTTIEQYPTCDNWYDNDNGIFVVDTIYGRKYVVAVDTVTGYAEIIGSRHNPTVIEDTVP